MRSATHIGLAAVVLLWTVPAAGAQAAGAPADRGGDLGCDTAHECTEPVDRAYDLVVASADDPGSAPNRSLSYADYMGTFACENTVEPAYEIATGNPADCA